jgi:hypothetical protein
MGERHEHFRRVDGSVPCEYAFLLSYRYVREPAFPRTRTTTSTRTIKTPDDLAIFVLALSPTRKSRNRRLQGTSRRFAAVRLGAKGIKPRDESSHRERSLSGRDELPLIRCEQSIRLRQEARMSGSSSLPGLPCDVSSLRRASNNHINPC